MHWTQTPEGREKMSKALKLFHRKKRELSLNGTAEVRESKGGIRITLEGADAHKALGELLSNVQYDNLNVRITIERK